MCVYTCGCTCMNRYIGNLNTCSSKHSEKGHSICSSQDAFLGSFRREWSLPLLTGTGQPLINIFRCSYLLACLCACLPWPSTTDDAKELVQERRQGRPRQTNSELRKKQNEDGIVIFLMGKGKGWLEGQDLGFWFCTADGRWRTKSFAN